ncbi:DUF4942 domain-containing protein [Roseovarius sp. MMSF_3281]|uniref:DUF4942 domain-containing protein n=1 Tax=Roseovarius sp. MMSF_3281 TaxID=3046694 RepID=UPI00273E4E52|nr:DUF4942 domain-containing protein [Roseovarius sp. MMSF_3281]
MTDQSNMPAVLRSLPDLVKEYETKRDSVADTVAAFKATVTEIEMQSTIGGTYAHSVWGRGSPYVHERAILDNLLKSAWMHVYKGLNLDKIASASDRNAFERSFENPPEFTLGNIRATFGHYVADPRHHILKGLAECFVDLDPAFKSHSKVKVGVEGLPKRIILRSVGAEYGQGYGFEKLRDTLNAIRVFEGQPHTSYNEISDLVKDAKRDQVEFEGMKLQVYKNGNGHLQFTPEKLRAINLALAEFYGDVLPDTPDAEPDQYRDLFRSREVSKDLQFYPTPRKVIDEVLRGVDWRDVKTILEPSCGDGRIMDAIREAVQEKCLTGVRMGGVEVNHERAEEARAKGHSVYIRNFLEATPTPDYDLIVMNPPFYGLHWQKHLLHARKFLKPHPEDRRFGGGTLICILPATAFYDGHLGKLGLVREDAHTRDRGWIDSGWRDLPVASFAESGTNIPTGFISIGPGQ